MPCFKRLRTGYLPDSKVDQDAERDEIVQKVIELIIAHIDRSYRPNPVLLEQSRKEIEHYINARVAHKFRQQVELHGLQEKVAAISQLKDYNRLASHPMTDNPFSSLKDLTVGQKGVANFDKTKTEKSTLGKIFRLNSNQPEADNDSTGNKKMSILRKIVTRFNKV